MANDTELPVLADLMALKVNGPTLVFLRPRQGFRDERLRAMTESLKNMKSQRPEFSEVTFIVMQSDFDIMAVGDADLERFGLTRLPATEKV